MNIYYMMYFHTNIHVYISTVPLIVGERREIKFPQILLQGFLHYADRNVGTGSHLMSNDLR
jgi:hypothetical protein